MDKPLLFSIWDGHEPTDVVRKQIAKFTGSSTKIDAIRPFLNDLSWDDFRDKSLRLDD